MQTTTRTITINGTPREYVDAFSCGPECTPHTYELRSGARVRETPIGWIMEYRGQGEWIAAIGGYAVRLESVER